MDEGRNWDLELLPDTIPDEPFDRHLRDLDPIPAACRCGRRYEWVWQEPPAAVARVVRPQWTHPAINPCASCKGTDDLDDQLRRMKIAQQVAGILPSHRAYRLERADTLNLGADEEQQHAWQNWLSDMPRRTFGVHLGNVKAYAKVCDWRPRKGLANSLFVQGARRTGKTLLLSMLLTRWLANAAKPMRWRAFVREDLGEPSQLARMSEAAIARRLEALNQGPGLAMRAPSYGLRIIRERDLVRDERGRKTSAGEKKPLERLCEQHVVVLDDACDRGEPTDDQIRVMEDLVWRRQRAQLPLIIATRTPWEVWVSSSAPLYGGRVASALSEMCAGGGVLTLTGAPWPMPAVQP